VEAGVFLLVIGAFITLMGWPTLVGVRSLLERKPDLKRQGWWRARYRMLFIGGPIFMVWGLVFLVIGD
jgi:hypothetical protein